MKRIRKILVFALTFAMVLGMTITSSAAESATITISGLTDGAVVTYKQIVEPSETSATGWKAVDQQVETALKTLTTEAEPDPILGYENASDSDRMAALSGIATSTQGGSVITVSSAGLYLINATDPNGKYIYKPMIASVGFDFDDAGTPSLKNAAVVAKKGPVEVEKVGDTQHIEIGDIVNYTVTSIIPFIPDGSTNQVFTITDTITNGEFVKNDAGEFLVSLTYGNKTEDRVVAVTKNADGKETFTIDLFDLTQLKDDDGKTNAAANTELTIKYSAKATDVVITNDAYPTYMDNVPGEHVSFKSVTGSITITKLGEYEEKLPGAKFVIIKNGKFAKLAEETNKLTGWVDTIGDATKLTTGEDGTVTAYGFDRDVENYKVQEIAAPPGYSLNGDLADVRWMTEPFTQDGVLIEDQQAKAMVQNTQLITLPYTGGSGTALFTAIGVILMSVAAGIYFANKRKMSK